MKKNQIITLALISLLCISMLFIMLPTAKAQETKYSFIFQGTFSGSITNGVFNIISGNVTINSCTFKIENDHSQCKINQFSTKPSGKIEIEKYISLSCNVNGKFNSNASNYAQVNCTSISINFSPLYLWSSTTGSVIYNATTTANLKTCGSTFILIGSNIESTPSESQPTTTPIVTRSAFVTNLVNMIEAPLILINGVFANWVIPANGTTPASLTQSGITLVNGIASAIETAVQIISNYLKTLANSQ